MSNTQKAIGLVVTIAAPLVVLGSCALGAELGGGGLGDFFAASATPEGQEAWRGAAEAAGDLPVVGPAAGPVMGAIGTIIGGIGAIMASTAKKKVAEVEEKRSHNSRDHYKATEDLRAAMAKVEAKVEK